MLLLPVMSVLSRRAGVVLLPTGVAFLCIAVAIDRRRPSLPHLKAILQSIPALAGLLIVAWCAISLLWTPYPAEAANRLLRLITTIVIVVAGYATLPDRVRTANAYLLPVGVTITSCIGILAALFMPSRMDEADAGGFERGLIVLVIFLWPALAWLRSRGRDLEALFLGAIAAIAVVLGAQHLAIAALAIGAIVFMSAAITPVATSRLLAGVIGGLLIFAPVFPFVAKFLSHLIPQGAITTGLEIWRRLILNDPLRLITGHGLETTLRDRITTVLSADAPQTVFFGVWYELGVVGACSAAAIVMGIILASGKMKSQMVSGTLATIASAVSFGMFGINSAQLWWFSTLATAILVLIAAERSQFRTERPPASFQ